MKTQTRRFKVIVAYDGGSFAGWQSQSHKNTVQDRLEEAVYSISREEVVVHGSGRTDTGVHALGQCAHFDLAGSKWTAAALGKALNAVLPRTIRILKCRAVSQRFHARFSVKAKIYRYRIWNADVLLPFEVGRSWHIVQPIDRAKLRSALDLFKGRHDFTGFSANSGRKIEDKIRTISRISLRLHGPEIVIEVEGDGFLYKMVRLIVGASMLCAEGRISLGELKTELREGGARGRRLVAPASGLYLVRVRY